MYSLDLHSWCRRDPEILPSLPYVFSPLSRADPVLKIPVIFFNYSAIQLSEWLPFLAGKLAGQHPEGRACKPSVFLQLGKTLHRGIFRQQRLGNGKYLTSAGRLPYVPFTSSLPFLAISSNAAGRSRKIAAILAACAASFLCIDGQDILPRSKQFIKSIAAFFHKQASSQAHNFKAAKIYFPKSGLVEHNPAA